MPLNASPSAGMRLSILHRFRDETLCPASLSISLGGCTRAGSEVGREGQELALLTGSHHRYPMGDNQPLRFPPSSLVESTDTPLQRHPLTPAAQTGDTGVFLQQHIKCRRALNQLLVSTRRGRDGNCMLSALRLIKNIFIEVYLL